jgi:hypothetical protein
LTRRSERGEFSEAAAREELAQRLERRQLEIEEAILRKIAASTEPAKSDDPEHQVGMRLAVPVAVAFGVAAVREGPEETPPVPTELLIQARTAAKHRVPIDAVLQRYIAGASVFDRALLAEISSDRRFGPGAARSIVESSSFALSLLAKEVSREHSRALLANPATSTEATANRLMRLLDEEPVRLHDIEYDFSATHIGAVADSTNAIGGLKQLASAAGGCLLICRPSGSLVWGWIGLRRFPSRGDLLRLARESWAAEIPLGLGEPGHGIGGWRRTHDQARIAFAHAGPGGISPTRYADVAVAHSVLQDGVLSSSLYHLYLAPLEGERDRGSVLLETLRAYFATSRNAASAAALLGVSRQTVANRLRAAEHVLNCSLADRATEIELALRMSEP